MHGTVCGVGVFWSQRAEKGRLEGEGPQRKRGGGMDLGKLNQKKKPPSENCKEVAD